MPTVRSKDGTQIAYDLIGQGPTLIMITGAICHRNFDPVLKDARIWGREFTVINYDRRGRGDSTDTLPYSPQREVEDVEALINANGGSAFVYGHSSGAALALEAGLELSAGKIKKIILADAPYNHRSEEIPASEKLQNEILKLIRKKENGKAIKTFLKGIGMPKIFVFLIPLMPGWKKIKALAPTLEYDLALTAGVAPVQKAARLKIPTHVIYGEKSPAPLPGVSQDLAKAIPGASLEDLKGQDHMMDANVVLESMKRFFKATP